jgi:acetyl esterase
MTVQNLILGVLRNSPSFLKRRLAGPPVEIDGNVMDANIQIMANMAAAEGGDPPSSVETLRASANAFDALNLPRRSGVSIEDTVLQLDGNSLEARIYTPRGATDSDPAVLFFHQGGLVIMHHLSDDHFCSVLADECGAKVISLNYRLCPEVAFPAPIEDGMALWHYVQDNAASLGIDPKRVALSGDSAGGLISASMTHMLRDAGGVQPAAQCLAYPWVSTDITGDPSGQSCSECFPLNTATMDFFNAMVFPNDKNLDHPLANPANNKNLKNLPPAVIGTAGFDPIRDQGNAYAKALEAAGNEVTHYCFTSLTHSYLLLGRVSHTAEKACVQLAQDLAGYLAK